LFSFTIDISEDEGEEASSSRAVGITSAEIRAKLEELSALLHQDTAQLVDLIWPKLSSRPLEVKSPLMLKKFFFKPHI